MWSAIDRISLSLSGRTLSRAQISSLSPPLLLSLRQLHRRWEVPCNHVAQQHSHSGPMPNPQRHARSSVASTAKAHQPEAHQPSLNANPSFVWSPHLCVRGYRTVLYSLVPLDRKFRHLSVLFVGCLIEESGRGCRALYLYRAASPIQCASDPSRVWRTVCANSCLAVLSSIE